MVFGFRFLSLLLLCQCAVWGSTAAFDSPCEPDAVPFPSSLVGDDGYLCIQDTISYTDSMKYLEQNLPSFDIINKGTYGFNNDGIDGIANTGTNASLEMRSSYRWAADIPHDIYREYVLPFSIINEARTNWRPLFTDAVNTILSNSDLDLEKATTSQVVQIINAGLWGGAVAGQTIVFKGDQTPLIYDAMSTLSYGYASCTGVSVFFINALRSVGLAARLAGTPAWNTVPENGNHNWVEVWQSETAEWSFIEAAPAGSDETLENPCDKWFCTPGNFANGTEVFASRYEQAAQVRYPMAWDLQNTAIPGEDRTSYYQQVCNAC